MTTRRVVVTGLGLVSPFGSDPQAFWQALAAGRSGMKRVSNIDLVEQTVVGAPVDGFTPRDHIDGKSLRLMAPAVAFGVAAAQLAVADAKLDTSAIEPVRLGAFVGSRGHSSDRQDLLSGVKTASESGEFSLATFGAVGLPLVHPMWLLKGLANNVLYFVSLKFNAQGMNNNISMTGVGGTMAIGEAFHNVQRGYVDVAIAGAYDSGLDVDRVEMFDCSTVFSRQADPAIACRPFDRDRDGLVLGEGAGFLVLEALEDAQKRGARIYGEIVGYGAATAPLSPSMLGPSSEGFANALHSALADAGGVTVDAIFAHGLATRESDLEETRAIKSVLGTRAATTPVPALKSMLANSFAASGPIETAAALLALQHGQLPPTITLKHPDPQLDLDYVPGSSARPAKLARVAVNNANLGGAHAALVLARVD